MKGLFRIGVCVILWSGYGLLSLPAWGQNSEPDWKRFPQPPARPLGPVSPTRENPGASVVPSGTSLDGQAQPNRPYQSSIGGRRFGFQPLQPAPPSSSQAGTPTATVTVGSGPLLRSTGRLNDICFLDAKTGIAVGDSGLIWRTIDGGDHWNACQSPVTCDLRAVAFDGQTGWAVGGQTLPVRGIHSGVVLKSEDGGSTWEELSTVLVPYLLDIQVGADHQLVATAIANDAFAYRLFQSRDAGHSWIDVPIVEPAGLTERKASANHAADEINPGWMEQQRFVISTAKGVLSAKDGQAILAKFETADPDSPVQFVSIASEGPRLFAISQHGRLWTSLDQGDRWLPWYATADPKLQAEDETFRQVTTSSGSAYFLTRQSGRILKYSGEKRAWEWLALPAGVLWERLHFLDAQHGWAIGPLGNVCCTDDGGQSWRWQHSLHPRLAVMVIARQTEDIPQSVLSLLSANNGLNVGVVCSDARLGEHVVRSVLNRSQVAFYRQDARLADGADDCDQVMREYLERLQPQILMVCPDERGSTNATQWISVAQEIRQQTAMDASNPWGIAGQTVRMTTDGGDASTSLRSFLPRLQSELRDACFEADLIQQSWSSRPREPVVSPGIRMIANAGIRDLSWFSGVSSSNSTVRDKLCDRPVASRPDPMFNLAQQVSLKQSWLSGFSAATTHTPELRTEWLQKLQVSLVQVPPELRQVWLVQLGTECDRLGDQRKACLSWLAAWEHDKQTATGLFALTRALPLLISDEVQWESRREQREQAQQELLASEQRLRVAMERGLTSKEAQWEETLRRWGIDPAMKEQVPPEIISRIEALEEARALESSSDGSPKTMLEIPDIQTQALRSTPTVRQFDDPSGNKVTRESTVVSWVTGVSEGSPNLASGNSFVSQANSTDTKQKTRRTAIDQTADDRIAFAYQCSRMADGLWPHLQSSASWWRQKARIARDMGDLDQLKASWTRATNYAQGDESREWKARGQFELKFGPLGNLGEPDVDDIPIERIPAVWADQRPHLDGRMDDGIWQLETRPSSLNGPVLRVAHDEQYLYLIVQVASSTSDRSAPGPATDPSVPRKVPGARDTANLKDAVCISIDTDCDYATSFQIVLDREGRVTDRQGTSSKWDPTLFVAQESIGSRMTFEIALDLSDVSLPRLGETWHIEVKDLANPNQTRSAWTRIRDPMDLLP